MELLCLAGVSSFSRSFSFFLTWPYIFMQPKERNLLSQKISSYFCALLYVNVFWWCKCPSSPLWKQSVPMLDAMHITNAGRWFIWKDLLQNQSQRNHNILCRAICGPALPDLWFSQQVSLTCITWCYSFWLQYWELILPLYLSECVCICVQVCVCMRVFCDRDSVSIGWPQTCYVAQYDPPYKYGATIAGLR